MMKKPIKGFGCSFPLLQENKLKISILSLHLLSFDTSTDGIKTTATESTRLPLSHIQRIPIIDTVLEKWLDFIAN